MKNSKKLLVLIPALGLFLSGCSFQEVKHSIGESWVGQHILHPIYDPIRDMINGGKKEEQKSGEDSSKPSGEEGKGEGEGGSQSGGESSSVNAKWPASDVASYLATGGITDKIPGYTGEAVDIKFDSKYGVMIEVASQADAESAKATYAADLKAAGFTEAGLDSDQDMQYLSKEGNIVVTPYVANDSSSGKYYVIVYFSLPAAPAEESTTFPLAKVQAALEISFSFPTPTGTKFEYTLDTEYKNSCYVKVYGGDLTAYVSALETAGYTVDDSYIDYGYATAQKDSFCLEIEAEEDSTDEYTINYFIAADSAD